MDYKIVVTAEAEADLDSFIQYLLYTKKNEQAAKNVFDYLSLCNRSIA